MNTIASTKDLVTAVPFLVGYQPTDSIVIVGLKDEDSIEVTMRFDYPEESNFEQYTHLAKTIMAQGIKDVILVTYVPSHIESPEVMIDLQITLNHYKIKIVDSIVVLDGKYRSVLCKEESCCPLEGTPLPDIKESALAVSQVLAGEPLPFSNVDALKASLRMYDEIPSIVSYITDATPVDDIEGQRLAAQTFDVMLEAFSEQGELPDDRDAGLLLVGLQDVIVRDYLLGSINDDNAQDITNLWRWLLLVAPPGYKAPVASLSAAVAYEFGRGAEAHHLIDIALEDEPGYSLATLLQRVFAAAWNPDSFKSMRQELHPKVVATLFENA